MLNKIEDYAYAGMKAAKARHQKDEATAQYWSHWMFQAVALEKPEDRADCRRAYGIAYREEAHSYDNRAWR